MTLFLTQPVSLCCASISYLFIFFSLSGFLRSPSWSSVFLPPPNDNLFFCLFIANWKQSKKSTLVGITMCVCATGFWSGEIELTNESSVLVFVSSLRLLVLLTLLLLMLLLFSFNSCLWVLFYKLCLPLSSIFSPRPSSSFFSMKIFILTIKREKRTNIEYLLLLLHRRCRRRRR